MTYPVAAVLTRDVGCDCNLGPLLRSAVCVHHAVIGAGAVTIDLVDGQLDLTARTDLGQLVARFGHDCLSAGFQIVLTTSNSLADRGGVGALEAGRVRLERVAASAVTRSSGDDTEGHTSAAGVASRGDDGTVASHEGDECEESGGLHCERGKVVNILPAQQDTELIRWRVGKREEMKMLIEMAR